MVARSIAQFLMQPNAPPRRIVSLCPVNTTIFDNRGSSSGPGSALAAIGNGGRGVRSVCLRDGSCGN